MQKETIVAISTAMTNSGIGIVRISGDEALSIIEKLYRGKRNKNISTEKTHTIHYGHIYDGENIIDEVLVLLMRAPNSYTGEDTVEIDCHGGIYVIQKVLETVIKHGARLAEPGEFTKRAFLNGRMDLSQAEAVMDVIESQNEYALKSSMKQLKGSVKQEVNKIRQAILYHTAFIESALDDPEHISIEGYGDMLKLETEKFLNSINELLSTSENGRIIKEGLKVVIVGKPNVGKSSLLNILLGEERAIVTDIAGTTRDILEESLNLDGIVLNILDTAGIRETNDVVEKIGVEKARNEIDDGDLILYVVDSSKELDVNDFDILETIKDKKVIILLNKSDLNLEISKNDFLNENKILTELNHPIVYTSAKNKIGLKKLEDTIKEMFFHGSIAFNDQIYITNIRHKEALQQAYNSLLKVIDSIENQVPEDFYSIDLIDAYQFLGSITGETIGEDLVNEIFSKFCMGK